MSLRYSSKKPSILKKYPPKRLRITKEVEKLLPAAQNSRLEEYNSKSIIDAINHILSRQWNLIPTQLNQDFQKHIQKYRNFVPRIVSRYQLYSVFPNNQTFIDQEIDRLFKDGKIKRVILQENDDLNDLIIENDENSKILNDHLQKSSGQTIYALERFRKFLEEKPETLKTTEEEFLSNGLTEKDIPILIKLGFLQISPQSSKTYLKISIPKYGYFLNLYQSSKKFILRQINANKWKEVKHNDLYKKWEQNKLKFKDFKGLNLNWILHWLIGEGTLEVFEISDGKAYKVIRK